MQAFGERGSFVLSLSLSFPEGGGGGGSTCPEGLCRPSRRGGVFRRHTIDALPLVAVVFLCSRIQSEDIGNLPVTFTRRHLPLSSPLKAAQTPRHRRTSIGRICLLVLTHPVRRHWKPPSNINETTPLSFALKATQTPRQRRTSLGHNCLLVLTNPVRRHWKPPSNIYETTSISFPLKATQIPRHRRTSLGRICLFVLTNPVRRHWKPPSNINETTPFSFALKATH